jgi:RNA polymerase sigma factor (sigma-70 family)
MGKPHFESILRQVRALADPRTAAASDAELLARFRARREEAAFAELLGRHGPMVLAVGRRLLGQDPEAEDVFQATFLLLARKAGAIRKPESVASWLHSVAQRLAVRARTQAARRQAHEEQAADMRRTGPRPNTAWQELQQLLDDALQQVPAKYRAALVLCYLEGKTQEEAAQQFGCAVGTVKSWLVRGRKLLQARLVRRGVVLSAGSLATALTASAASAAVPALLVQPTLAAALQFGSGQTAAALVSARTAALVNTGLQLLVMGKLKAATPLLIALVLLCAGAAVAYQAAERGSERGIQPAQPQAGTEGALRNSRPPLRVSVDFQGDPLPPDALARLGTTRFRHAGLVERLALSPDGKAVATWSASRLWQWEAGTGKLARRVGPIWADLHGLAFLPDGKSLAVLSRDDGEVCLWDFASGKPPPADAGRECPTTRTCCAVSGNGKVVALWSQPAGEGDGLIRTYQIDAGQEFHALKEVRRFDAPRAVCWLMLSPDGKRLLSVGPPGKGGDRDVRLWDVAAGEELHQLGVATAQWMQTSMLAAFSPDGRTLALAAADKTIQLWDVACGQERIRLSGHTRAVVCLAFSPDGQTLASGGSDPAVRLWNVDSGRMVHEFKLERGNVASVAFSADGRTLATGGTEGLVRLWDVDTGREALAPAGLESTIAALAVTADGGTVVMASWNGTLRLWDMATGRQRRRLEVDPGGSAALSFASHGRTLAWSNGMTVQLWDVDVAGARDVKQVQRELAARPLAVAPGGRTVAALTPDRAVCLWDTVTGRVTSIDTKERTGLTRVAFSADSQVLATAEGVASPWAKSNLTMSLWDVATGQLIRRFPLPYDQGPAQCWISAIAFSPDGTFLASASRSFAASTGPISGQGERGNPIRLWDVASGREVRPFPAEPGHGVFDIGGANCVAFSPDGVTLAAGEANDIVLYEVATGKVRRRLEGHNGQVQNLAFAADGRVLVSSAADLTALVWDLRRSAPGEVLQAGASKQPTDP